MDIIDCVSNAARSESGAQPQIRTHTHAPSVCVEANGEVTSKEIDIRCKYTTRNTITNQAIDGFGKETIVFSRSVCVYAFE